MKLEALTTTLTPLARDLLKTAHAKYDIYFSGFLHTHLSHGMLSLNALHHDHVSDEELQAHYNAQSKMLQARSGGTTTLTVDNWYESLKDGMNTKSSCTFLDFFDEQVTGEDCSFEDTLITYVLDPRIVNRLIGGAVHPLIHLGYACELAAKEPETAKLLLSEALAMQCTTRNQFEKAINSLEPLEEVNTKQLPLSGENRVLTVLEAMSRDEALTNVPTKDNPDQCDYTISRVDVMGKYYNMFPVTTVQTALEHLFFGALAIVFGSIKPEEEPLLDFFLAHLLTSAVSLRQVLPYIQDDATASTLCRYHFVAILAWYRARGHPKIDVENLMKQPTPLNWDECQARLEADPALEVHSLKVLRALQMGQSEEWARDALDNGILPGVTKKIWLICANLLVRQIRSGHYGGFMWLHGNESWEYYKNL